MSLYLKCSSFSLLVSLKMINLIDKLLFSNISFVLGGYVMFSKLYSFKCFSIFVSLNRLSPLVLDAAIAYLNDLLPSFLLFSGMTVHFKDINHFGVLVLIVVLIVLIVVLIVGAVVVVFVLFSSNFF